MSDIYQSKFQFMMLSLLVAAQLLSAQNVVTISGKVLDGADSIPLVGAWVYQQETGRLHDYKQVMNAAFPGLKSCNDIYLLS